MLAFNKQVNASIVDPDFIASVRKKLDLDQREAGEIFGGGVNAFSRYENGRTKPPLALVKLLKVLDRHPDFLTEIKGRVALPRVRTRAGPPGRRIPILTAIACATNDKIDVSRELRQPTYMRCHSTAQRRVRCTRREPAVPALGDGPARSRLASAVSRGFDPGV